MIGAGGLGHVALQLLRQPTPTRVIALDIGQDKLDFAKDNGARGVRVECRGCREGKGPHRRARCDRGAGLRRRRRHRQPGGRKELLELVAMATRGQIEIRTTTYPIDEGEKAYAGSP